MTIRNVSLTARVPIALERPAELGTTADLGDFGGAVHIPGNFEEAGMGFSKCLASWTTGGAIGGGVAGGIAGAIGTGGPGAVAGAKGGAELGGILGGMLGTIFCPDDPQPPVVTPPPEPPPQPPQDLGPEGPDMSVPDSGSEENQSTGNSSGSGETNQCGPDGDPTVPPPDDGDGDGDGDDDDDLPNPDSDGTGGPKSRPWEKTSFAAQPTEDGGGPIGPASTLGRDLANVTAGLLAARSGIRA